jgi:hypothetical protein
MRITLPLKLIQNYSAFVLFSGLWSCGPANQVYDVQVDLSNALRAKFVLSTEKEASVSIEFWDPDDQVHFSSTKTNPQYHHEIYLLDLKPNTTYHYAFLLEMDNQMIQSDVREFMTDSIPEYLPSMDLVIDSGDVFSGYVLIRNVQPPGQQILIDHKGRIVWYEVFDTTLFRPFSWTDHQTILALKSDREIHEFDLKGNMLFNLKYGEKGFNRLLHHEILRDKTGNILSLTRNNQLFDLSERGGDKADTVKGDGILVLDSTGNKIWEWDLFEWMDPQEDDSILWTKNDWSHANSLSIAEDGNYLVSFRHFNQVWKIDAGSGEIIWKLGEGGDFLMEKEQLFYLQHTAHMNKYGELLLFDNGGPERFSSRAISFVIDPQHKEVKTGRINVFLPKALFSFKQGSAYLIDQEKILFCSSIKKSIVITDLEGHILWQLNLSESVYRADYINEIDWERYLEE